MEVNIMSDLKEEKKVEIKEEKHAETKENIKKEQTPKKEKKANEIELRRYRPLSIFKTIDQFFNNLTPWFDDFYWKPNRFWDLEPLNMEILEDEPFFRTPLANITDEEERYSITAELPGLEKGDLKITIHDGNLEIKGETKEEREEKNDGNIRKEYSSSSYYRCFNLPENVDEDKIDATLDKGVLKLILPKKEEEKKEKRKIEVK